MEQLIILVIWVIGSAFIKSSNEKKKKGYTNKRASKGAKTLKQNATTVYSQDKKAGGSKKVFDSFMVEVEKELRREKEQRKEKELQREKQRQKQFDSQWIQSSVSQPSEPSQQYKPKKPPKPKSPPKPKGLWTDMTGGDEEIGIQDTPLRVEQINKLDFDLKKDILKGIIYAEILSEPKSLRNIKRSR